jgi:iron complex outermembrane recepter protein
MRVALMATAVSLSVVGLSAASDAEAAMREATSIPPERLDLALQTLSRERGFAMAYRSDLVGDRQTAGALGDLTRDEALTQLLSGTGLTYRFIDEKTVTILPLAAKSTGSAAPVQQPAAAARNESREGTRGFLGPFRLARADQGSASETASLGASHTPQNGAVQLEEVVVTAQKRQERLIDTPLSVSVLSGEDINKLGAIQFRDFATTVPGLDFTTAGTGYTQISLRGVTAGFDVGSTVGIYVDDVPYGSSSAFAQGGQVALDVGLFDMSRIEVLRGPQGTLYGASTMGGLIKYVTHGPDVTAFSGSAQTGVASTRDGGINYNAAVVVNAPLSANSAALRASAFYSRDAGYIDNAPLGDSNSNRSGVYGARLDLLFLPADNLSIRLAGFLQDISRTGEATADYSLDGRPLYGDLVQFRRVPEPFAQHFRLGSATIDYDFGPAKLTSITSYQTTRTELTYDATGGYAADCSFAGVACSAVGLPQELSTNKATEELRLASGDASQLQWLLGGFYTHESSDNAQAFSLFDLQGAPASADLYHELNSSRYEEYAGFLDLTYHTSLTGSTCQGARDTRATVSRSHRLGPERSVPPHRRAVQMRMWLRIWRMPGIT